MNNAAGKTISRLAREIGIAGLAQLIRYAD